jgi:hypothetical protein
MSHIPKIYDYNKKEKIIYREYINGTELGLNATPYALFLNDLDLEDYLSIWKKYKGFLHQLHEKSILLCDIWMNNIIFQEDDFHIIDFELAGNADAGFENEMISAELLYGNLYEVYNVIPYKRDVKELQKRREQRVTYLTYIPYPYPCHKNAIYNNGKLDCRKTIQNKKCPFGNLLPSFNYPTGTRCWLEWPMEITDFFTNNYNLDFDIGYLFFEISGRLFNFFVKHLSEQLNNENFISNFSDENIVFLQQIIDWFSVVLRENKNVYLIK